MHGASHNSGERIRLGLGGIGNNRGSRGLDGRTGKRCTDSLGRRSVGWRLGGVRHLGVLSGSILALGGLLLVVFLGHDVCRKFVKGKQGLDQAALGIAAFARRDRTLCGSAGLLGHKSSGRGIQLHGGVRMRGSRKLARMHNHHTAVVGCHKVEHLGIGEARHVVDDRGAHAHGGLGHLDMARIDRDNGTTLSKRADHRQHATCLFVGRDGREAGTRGLAAHVDDVGAVVEHLEAVRDGGLGIHVLAAVAKGIGRNVEDAHDARAIKLELVLPAAPDFGVVSHRCPFENCTCQ